MASYDLIFYHSPNTRSSVTLQLLDELEALFELRVLNMKANEQRRPDYRAVNPMGKVPAIVHNGAVITEQPACFIYLADLFAEKGLAPAIGDPMRGLYLRWIVFYGSSFEPAIVDRSLARQPAPPSTAPYGDFDTMLSTLVGQLETGPWLLGDRFTAADVLWGGALSWTVGFGLVPDQPRIRAYIDRFSARPSGARVRERDAELAAAHEAAMSI